MGLDRGPDLRQVHCMLYWRHMALQRSRGLLSVPNNANFLTECIPTKVKNKQAHCALAPPREGRRNTLSKTLLASRGRNARCKHAGERTHSSSEWTSTQGSLPKRSENLLSANACEIRQHHASRMPPTAHGSCQQHMTDVLEMPFADAQPSEAPLSEIVHIW